MQAISNPDEDYAYPSDSIRKRERALLALAALFVVLNRVSLTLVLQDNWLSLWPVAVWLACAIALHIVLDRLLPRRDPLIMPIVMFLAGWGLTLIARLAAPIFAERQVLWLCIGALAAALMGTLSPTLRILQRYRYTWLLGGLLLLGATFILGTNPSGDPYAPKLWLGFTGIYFQPSELLKVLLIIFLASYLADKREVIVTTQIQIGRWKLPRLTYVAPMLLMWGFCVILLVWQRDLGTASLFFLVFLAMLYVSTGEVSYAVVGLILLLMAGVAGYFLFGVVRLRVDTWWNPWPEADTRAYQIVQSLLAVAAGGVFGDGIGQGAPYMIPVVHSDFVFAAIAEEYGMIGSLGVLICLAILVLRAIKIASENIRYPFRALLAAGVGIVMGVQSLLIMAGVLKILPLTGITLPFVSYGGSSLLSSFIMIGLLLRISDGEHHENWFHKPPAPDFAP